jgi:hypothetical protein
MTEPLNHKLDISKIKTLKDVKNVFECMSLYANASEENEQYELIKEYFTIPNEPQELTGFKLPRKSLEEISQEFDEKIDKQIEDVEYKFAQLKYYQEYQFSKKITRIIEDIEYARKNGSFPAKLDYSKLTATGGSNFTPSLVIKEGGKEVGYYTFGNGYLKYYMNKKPTAISRWFVKNCLAFTWVDT